MRLPFSFPFGKKEKKQYFLALLLQDETVGSVIFEESASSIHIVSRSEEYFPTSLHDATYEELLDIVDKTISIAEENFHDKIQVTKTILGLKQDWISDGKIKKEYLIQLKKICDELSLEPIGFLVFTEAIMHLLQKEEGAPVSAILVETGKKYITASLIRAGRIVEVKRVAFSEPVVAAIDSALKHFANAEILPSRIILFDSEASSSLSQQLIHHTWSKSLPFLHVPQTTILPAEFATKAVLLGTADQMGFRITNNEIAPLAKRIAPLESVVTPQETQEEKLDAETQPEEVAPEDIPEEVTPIKEDSLNEAVSADYFGFVKSKDVAKTPHKVQQKYTEPQTVAPEADNFVAAEIAEIPEEVKEETTQFDKKNEFAAESMMLRKGTVEGVHVAKNMLQKWFHGLQQKTKTMPPKTHAAHHQEMPAQNRAFLLIIPAVLLVIIGGIALYIFGIKATVQLSISPKVVENQDTITFVPEGTTNSDNNTIATQVVTTDEKGNTSANTTGTKDVGTPAKGQVTIFSRLADTTSLDKGTIITAANGLKFTLDSDVSIASFSGGPEDPSVTVDNVAVTANDIGKDYNLPSGTKFTISGQSNSDVSAKNDTAFSGGDKQSIQIVSQKDVDTLLASLTKSLEGQAKTDLQKTVDSDKQLLPLFTKEDVTDKTLSKSVGSQATSVNVAATITYETQAYAKNDITQLALQKIKNSISNDLVLTPDGVQLDMTNVQQNKNTITADVTMKALLIPKLDTKTLTQSISGKSFEQTQQMLSALPQIEKVTITLHPNLPFLPKVLPRLSGNITVITQTNE